MADHSIAHPGILLEMLATGAIGVSCAGGREVSAFMGTGAPGPGGGQGSAGPSKVAARISPTSPHSAHLERLKEHCILCPLEKELEF